MEDAIGARSAASGRAVPAGGTPDAGEPAAAWCDRCGGALGDGDHTGCAAARALEPPRYCRHCRRRMKVQVVPGGWTARCAAHGETAGGEVASGDAAGNGAAGDGG